MGSKTKFDGNHVLKQLDSQGILSFLEFRKSGWSCHMSLSDLLALATT